MANLQIAPACKIVEPQHVEMMVPLYSYGCGRKIKKALSHLRGIYSVTVEYKLQKVTVWGICNKYDVLATIRSKRKEARFWDSDSELTSYHDDDKATTCPSRDEAATISAIHDKLWSLSLYWRTWKKKAALLKSYYRN